MLPCNIVVQEHENGEIEISAINLLENVDNALKTAQVGFLATKMGNRLRGAIDNLEHDLLVKHVDALPADEGHSDNQFSIQG